MNNETLLHRIASVVGDLSPKQKIVAKYIEENHTSLAYTTMTELSRMAGVSETSVVRFVYRLGYNGFPEFMAALRNDLSEKKETPLMNGFAIEKENFVLPRDTCKAVFAMEMQAMTDTLTNMNDDDFHRAVAMISKAKEVFIAGCGANTCCTRAMEFAMQVIKPNVVSIENCDLAAAAKINAAGRNSVCIAFTTPRYPSETDKIVKLMKENAIPIIGVSNSILSPLRPFCEIFFQIPEKYVTYIDSNAAYMALIHAITFGVYQSDTAKAKQQVAKYNAFVRETEYYLNGSAELVDLETNCRQ